MDQWYFIRIRSWINNGTIISCFISFFVLFSSLVYRFGSFAGRFSLIHVLSLLFKNFQFSEWWNLIHAENSRIFPTQLSSVQFWDSRLTVDPVKNNWKDCLKVQSCLTKYQPFIHYFILKEAWKFRLIVKFRDITRC